MDLAVLDLVAISTVFGGTVTAFSLLYTKFITPAKKIFKQVEDNKKDIQKLEDKISTIKTNQLSDNIFSTEVRALLFESLLAILEGLEEQGCNGKVKTTKQELIKFMSSQIGAGSARGKR